LSVVCCLLSVVCCVTFCKALAATTSPNRVQKKGDPRAAFFTLDQSVALRATDFSTA
jgi:hypothetical protein